MGIIVTLGTLGRLSFIALFVVFLPTDWSTYCMKQLHAKSSYQHTFRCQYIVCICNQSWHTSLVANILYVFVTKVDTLPITVSYVSRYLSVWSHLSSRQVNAEITFLFCQVFLCILRIVEFEQAQLMKYKACFPHTYHSNITQNFVMAYSVSSSLCNAINTYHMYMNMLCILSPACTRNQVASQNLLLCCTKEGGYRTGLGANSLPFRCSASSSEHNYK